MAGQSPRIIFSVANELFEQDCACPASTPSPLSHPSPLPAALQVPPGLYRAPLPQDYELVFNPLGDSRLAVLNQPALRVLEAFETSMKPSQAISKLAEIYPPDARQAVQLLVDMQLLQATGTPRLPLQMQAQTLTAWLHVTNACSMRCDYCYINKTSERMDLGLGLDAVQAVFRSAQQNGFHRVKLKYAGGEPLLNLPVILALHDRARQLAFERGLELEGVVLSNGIAIKDSTILKLAARDLRLAISLDGFGAIHDAQRPLINGNGSFAHIERSLDRLAAHGLKPSITITISNRNLAGLVDVVSYVLERGLPFTLNFYRENDCSAPFTDLVYQDEQVIATMKAAFAVIERNLPSYSLLGALVDRARLDAPHDRTCGVGHSYLVIDQRGGVAKCHMEIERTITDISAQDPLDFIRQDPSGLLNLPVEEKEGCRECTWRYWCAGGCPALTFRITGRFDVKSPNCRIYKELFPDVLRLEGLRLLKYHARDR